MVGVLTFARHWFNTTVSTVEVTNVGLKDNSWHYVGICRACWTRDIEQQDICQRRVNKTANKMSTLAKPMIAIWDLSSLYNISKKLLACGPVHLNGSIQRQALVKLNVSFVSFI